MHSLWNALACVHEWCVLTGLLGAGEMMLAVMMLALMLIAFTG